MGNAITNQGVIEAFGGILTLGGKTANAAGGLMSAVSGNKLLVNQGLAQNQGRISLKGGIYENNGHTMTNAGQITGYGTLRTAGLTNDSGILLAGGSSTVDGRVTNSSSGNIEVAYGHATFNDDVVNDGLFKTTEASVSFAGNFTNNGTYFRDPSIQSFTSLNMGENGILIGLEQGDIFKVSGDFISASTRSMEWNTAMAGLEFIYGINGNAHTMSLTGVDMGAELLGYQNNFAWGRMDITGNSLNLLDGNEDNLGGFYVGGLAGVLIDEKNGLITNITGIDGLNLYYLAGLEENAYLDGRNYGLATGGHLMAVTGTPMPTPIPGAVWLMCSGLIGLVGLRRRMEK